MGLSKEALENGFKGASPGKTKIDFYQKTWKVTGKKNGRYTITLSVESGNEQKEISLMKDDGVVVNNKTGMNVEVMNIVH